VTPDTRWLAIFSILRSSLCHSGTNAFLALQAKMRLCPEYHFFHRVDKKWDSGQRDIFASKAKKPHFRNDNRVFGKIDG
jgi:hypothetical protein